MQAIFPARVKFICPHVASAQKEWMIENLPCFYLPSHFLLPTSSFPLPACQSASLAHGQDSGLIFLLLV